MIGLKKARELNQELATLAKKYYDLHNYAYNAGADEKVSELYYSIYSQLSRIELDIDDLAGFIATGRHYAGYGTSFGIDPDTLEQLELK